MIEEKVFRPKARLISTIGAEIIKDNYAAIIELVKNAYDADANEVVVKFDKNNQIIINDNGIGMSKETILNKWLVPATDDKLINKLSPSGRSVQGRKGIGRFSVGVLGEKMEMHSVHNGKECVLKINWKDFNSSKYLDEVKIELDEHSTTKNNGVEFIILQTEAQVKEWNDDTLGQLIKELNKTITPISKDSTTFQIKLKIDSSLSVKYFGETLIKPYPILDLFNYSAIGSVTGQNVNFIYENKYENNQDNIEFNLGDKIINICGKINFEFRAFDRDPSVIKDIAKNEIIKNINGPNMNDTEIREMLNEACGVFIYRNEFRIRPYGDVDFDWLNLDKERVQNPSEKLGANQLFGIIKIEDEEKSHLVDKSARDGLKQDEAYATFKKIILLIIKQIENKRYSYRKKTGKGRAVKTSDNYIILDTINKLSSHKEIETDISNILKNEQLSNRAKEKIDSTFEKYNNESERVAKQIQEQIAMYQGQATLGKIMDVIIHEVKKPLSWFVNVSENLKSYYEGYLNSKDILMVEEILRSSNTSAEQSEQIISLFKRLDPLSTKTRTTCKNINIFNLINDVLTIFKNKIIEKNIIIDLKCEKTIVYFGWKSDLMMCLTNIIDNSIYWLTTKDGNKRIEIKVQEKNASVFISIIDNGPGIPIDYIASGCIFDPGFSGKIEGGSGLGLPIAGEALARNGGTIKAIEHEGGAYFLIELPIMGL